MRRAHSSELARAGGDVQSNPPPQQSGARFETPTRRLRCLVRRSCAVRRRCEAAECLIRARFLDGPQQPFFFLRAPLLRLFLEGPQAADSLTDIYQLRA